MRYAKPTRTTEVPLAAMPITSRMEALMQRITEDLYDEGRFQFFVHDIPRWAHPLWTATVVLDDGTRYTSGMDRHGKPDYRGTPEAALSELAIHVDVGESAFEFKPYPPRSFLPMKAG